MFYKIKNIYLILITIILFIYSLPNIVYGAEESNDISTSANLQQLQLDIEGIVPIFEKDIYEYYLTIPTKINEIQITAIPENQKATVEIFGNSNLKEGLNEIKIQVKINTNIQNTYTIFVTKTDNLELANTKLENLAIEGIFFYPPFDTNRTYYTLDVPFNNDKLNILAIPENESSQITVTGNNNLKEGNNIINIVVTAPNGFTQKKYVLKANKRNQKQETDYQKEEMIKQKQVEQLNNIYTAKRTSTNVVQDDKDGRKFFWALIFMIIAGIVILFAIYKNFHE